MAFTVRRDMAIWSLAKRPLLQCIGNEYVSNRYRIQCIILQKEQVNIRF